MPKASAIFPVELRLPFRLSDRPVRFQSLWLLVRIYYSQTYERSSLPIAVVQARFPGKANLRMLISRAFSDFSQWGIAAGWGADQREPALLNPSRRSHGPFWLTEQSAARLRFTLDGRKADKRMLADFLGLDAQVGKQGSAVDYVMQDVAYWNHLTQAMRVSQDGLPGGSDTRVTEVFRAAQNCAQDNFQSALAVLKEGLAWRRYGHLDRSLDALKRLDLLLAGSATNSAMPTFSAMSFIARGWDFYAQDDIGGAQSELNRLLTKPELQPVIRYNPRVRFEYLNLQALIHKTNAMRGKQESDACARAADAAIKALSEALQAAYEADSIDAAQHVAANIGLLLWLFWKNRLIDRERKRQESELQMQALRWLGLSEWICDRFGVGGGSAWNIVFLVRIARGSCPDVKGTDVTRFRAQAPLNVKDVVNAVRPFHAPFSPAKGYHSWSGAIAFALEEHDTGRVHYGPLQLANLLLEATWFQTFEHGLAAEAFAAAERLAVLMRGMRQAERRFFSDAVKALPHELQITVADALRKTPRPAKAGHSRRAGK